MTTDSLTLKKEACAGLVVLAVAASCLQGAAAVTNYWNGGTAWGDFGALANWSTGGKLSAGGTAATALPGENDFICCDPTLSGNTYYLGLFDLGGNSYTIKGWCASSLTWKSQYVCVSNGTLTVKEPADTASGSQTMTGRRFVIESGGKLVYPAGNTIVGGLASSGLPETWEVRNNAEAEIYAGISIQGPSSSYNTSTVKSGGRMVFDPSVFMIGSSNSGGVSIDNFGVLELPHGLDWSGNGWTSGGCNEDRLRLRQMGGTMLLGGEFKKTGMDNYVPGRMTFVLGGGTLVVTNSVTFYTAPSAYNVVSNFYDQVYAEMPDNAVATVDVKVDSLIDMTLFTYGADTQLTKTGPGKMTVGAFPEALSVSAGTVAFAEALNGLDGITLADGLTVEFDAKGNAISSLANADKMKYTLGAGFGDGDTIVASSDAALLNTIVEKFVLPDYLADDYVLRIRNGAVVLLLSVPVEVRVLDLTLYVGDAATNAGYVVVNKKTGAIIDSPDIQGTPVYTYEYTQGDGTGTYPVSVSGLTSDPLDISYKAATMTVAPADERLTFYWNGGQVFGDFGAVSNWTMDAEYQVPATRLPGRNDLIAHRTQQYGSTDWGSDYYIGKWNLQGTERSFYGYTTGTVFIAWKNWWIDVTNGVLTVRNPTVYAGSKDGSNLQFGHLYNVWKGATLYYPADTYETALMAASGLIEFWSIHAGGTVRVEGGLWLSSSDGYTGGGEISAGGTLFFDPKKLGVSSSSTCGIQYLNRGTMYCPHGLVWDGTGYNQKTSVASGRDEMLFIQESGLMSLGGDIMRTNNSWASNVKMPSRLELILKGGTLEITNSVRVATSENSYQRHIAEWGEEKAGGYRKQAFASLADNADVTINLTAGSFLDMTEFTYGTAAKLTTTGTGRLHFGAEIPSVLTVGGGVLDFADPSAATPASTVKLDDGATGVFPLRVWKDGSGNVVNDTLDLTDGLEGTFKIRPTAHGFRFSYGDKIRLGAYDAALELPSADFACRGWEFCRVAGDANALYLHYTGYGAVLLIR